MSGGSLDYLYLKVEDAASEIAVNESFCGYGDKYHRKAFAKHLKRVALALHAIEWNIDDDGHEDENELIEACIGEHCDLAEMISEAQRVKADIEKKLGELNNETK